MIKNNNFSTEHLGINTNILKNSILNYFKSLLENQYYLFKILCKQCINQDYRTKINGTKYKIEWFAWYNNNKEKGDIYQTALYVNNEEVIWMSIIEEYNRLPKTLIKFSLINNRNNNSIYSTIILEEGEKKQKKIEEITNNFFSYLNNIKGELLLLICDYFSTQLIQVI